MKKEAIHRDTDFLRFIAIILIVNSHLYQFYPNRNLAVGGTFGNSLFFMLSSLCLYLSFRKKPRNFREFYFRRIRRIYPSVWVLVFALIVPLDIIKHNFDYKDILTYAGQLFWPPFWFLQAIMIYYLFFYLLVKNLSKKKLFFAFSVTAIIYLSVYIYYLELMQTQYTIGFTPYCVPFYFLIFLFGIWMGTVDDKIKFAGTMDVILLFLFLCFHYLFTFLMFKGQIFTFQFVEQLAVFPVVFYALKISRSPLVLDRVMNNPVLSKIVVFISSITLEIYMCHFLLLGPFIGLKIPFPFNIFIFVTVSIALAFVVKYISQNIVIRLEAR